MSEKECKDLIKEANEAVKHDLKLAASIYEEVAKCFDSNGNRKKAAQYLTLAGDFFLDINNKEKAATCYGKAIVRYLMIDDTETAYILLEKGKSYGFTSATHQYRIALDTMERKSKLQFDNNLEKEKNLLDKEELITQEKIAAEIEILPIDEEEEDLIPLDPKIFNYDDDTQVTMRDFIIPQLEEIDESKFDSFSILAAVSKTKRKKTDDKFQTNAVVRDKNGDSKYIIPTFSLNRINNISNQEMSERIEKNKSKNTESNITENEKESLKNELLTSDFLKKNNTIDLNYSAKTELSNEYEEELTDIEIIDTIPFKWQIIDIDSDFELGEKRSTSEGIVFTWRKNSLEAGNKASVEYILRKRIERSIILRKENNKVVAITLFQSVKQELEAELNFVNTSGKNYQEILIEDIIPPELIVKEKKSSKNIKPIKIPTHDSTIYRWIFRQLTQGDNFIVNYKFREKPLTRHYIEEFEIDSRTIKIEKISQPLIDSKYYEYIWFYTIEHEVSNEFTLIDRIPSDYEIILLEPMHLRPSIRNERTQNILSWKITPSDSKIIIVIIRIKGLESFTPIAPTIETTKIEQFQLIDRTTLSEKKMINLRKLREQIGEVD